MLRFWVCIFLLSTPALAWAGSAPEGATADNSAYYETLVNVFFNLTLKISLLLAIIAVGLIGWSSLRTVINPSLVQQLGSKPMTFARAIGGLMVVSILAFPLTTMNAFNDLTGLATGSRTMCLVVDVDPSNSGWVNNANDCVNRVEQEFSELAGYQDQGQLSSANLGLLFGAIQLLSLAFFIVSSWMLVMHIIGAREVKMTVMQAIMSMIIASAIMALPNLADYIQDFRGEQSVVIDS